MHQDISSRSCNTVAINVFIVLSFTLDIDNFYNCTSFGVSIRALGCLFWLHLLFQLVTVPCMFSRIFRAL